MPILVVNAAASEPETLYHYTNDQGVIVFSQQIDTIPSAMRQRAKVIDLSQPLPTFTQTEQGPNKDRVRGPVSQAIEKPPVNFTDTPFTPSPHRTRLSIQEKLAALFPAFSLERINAFWPILYLVVGSALFVALATFLKKLLGQFLARFLLTFVLGLSFAVAIYLFYFQVIGEQLLDLEEKPSSSQQSKTSTHNSPLSQNQKNQILPPALDLNTLSTQPQKVLQKAQAVVDSLNDSTHEKEKALERISP